MSTSSVGPVVCLFVKHSYGFDWYVPNTNNQRIIYTGQKNQTCYDDLLDDNNTTFYIFESSSRGWNLIGSARLVRRIADRVDRGDNKNKSPPRWELKFDYYGNECCHVRSCRRAISNIRERRQGSGRSKTYVNKQMAFNACNMLPLNKNLQNGIIPIKFIQYEQ